METAIELAAQLQQKPSPGLQCLGFFTSLRWKITYVQKSMSVLSGAQPQHCYMIYCLCMLNQSVLNACIDQFDYILVSAFQYNYSQCYMRVN